MIALALGQALVALAVGQEIDERWERRILHGTIGRVVRHERLDRALSAQR